MPILGNSITQGVGQGQVLVSQDMATRAGPVGPGTTRRAAVTVRAGMLPWLPFWLALGIGPWFLLRDEPGPVAYLAAVGIAASGLVLWLVAPALAGRGRISWRGADRLRLLALAGLVIAAGFLLAGLRSWSVAAPVLDYRYYGPVEGRVIEIDRSARDRMRMTLDHVVLDDVAAHKLPRKVRISLFDADPLPVPGQWVMLTAHLGPPNGPAEPGGFDFRRMAWFEGLGAIGYARVPVLTVAPPDRGGALALHRLRMQMAAGMRSAIGGQAGAVSAALMTGDRSGITERTNEVMRASNLYHIISISGLHMSMLAGFVYAGLRLLGVGLQGAGLVPGAGLHKWAAGGALLASAVYLWLSGGGVATERSFIMVAVMLGAIIADRRAVSLRTVAVAAALILVYAPEGLTSAGFQMSFAATVALILSLGPWQQVAPHLPWWLRPVVMLIVSSFLAGLVTSPIAAAHFGRMTQYGLLANMLVVPVVGAVVMPAGVIAGLLAPLGLAQPALWVMGLGTTWMLFVAQWVAGLNGAVTRVPAPPTMVLPMMGIGAMLLILAPVAVAHGQMPRWPWRKLAGGGVLVLSALLWLSDRRPLLLISAEGDAAAVLGQDGRVPSKSKGGAFAVAEWLEADGDAADQPTAAARPLWQGPRGTRSAILALPGGDVAVSHLTGKAAARRAADLCGPQSILVSDADLSGVLGRAPACVVFDRQRLRRTGALAITSTDSGYRIVTTQMVAGNRDWTGGRGD